LRGRFIDGLGRGLPDTEYKPQATPWFDTAVRNPDTRTAYTEPYIDPKTGTAVFTAVRNIYGRGGDRRSILAIDMDMSWLSNFVYTFSVGDDSYGIVLNQYMVVVGHPREENTGRLLREISDGYRAVHDVLMQQRGEVSTMRIRTEDGVDAVVSFKQMFNGWYIGVVVPYSVYYRDVNNMTAALSILGVVLMSILSYFLLRLSAAQIRSEEENRSKTTFLALMSHEIRTPMNAVIGLSELGLRTENPSLIAEYFNSIQHAGQNLLSVIDDILDFSKMGAGNLRLTPAPYTLASLLNDVINITRVRLSGKEIYFLVNVESAIPNKLIGDETRVRQVLLNLLSNAVKYTAEGFVRFTVTFDRTQSNAVLLKFTVADSGIGIKPEDIEQLFGDFVRFDALRNKGVEGTGLGLAIVKRLCLAMDGDITVSSQYGQGSVFTAVIPQSVENNAPLAEVGAAREKRVLFYDSHSLYAESIQATLDDLGVKAVRASSESEFFDKLIGGDYTFALVSVAIAARARECIRQRRLSTSLALLGALGDTTPVAGRDAPVIFWPAYAVSIASVLNQESFVPGAGNTVVADFIAPKARVLLVDDMPTNLVVARGLLLPYGMQVDTCESGEEAVERVRENIYDLVLMDHMMPGMDGVEATVRIRRLRRGRKLPVVALTANAVTGMRELFLQKGMNDFLSKPIDTAKLNDLLHRWIPAEKQQAKEASECVLPDADQGAEQNAPNAPFMIDGLDTEKGLFMSGGTEANYRGVLEQYRRDADARLHFLTFAHAVIDLKHFITQVHALKSASASVGATDVSEEAKALEDAGDRADMSFIRNHVDGFRDRLSRLCGRIDAALGAVSARARERNAPPDAKGEETLSMADIAPFLLQLKQAMTDEDVGACDRLLAELSDMPLDSAGVDTLAYLADMVLVSEFAEAARAIDDFLKS
jgi:signal transduction histidine kinase/CheY-like chemotaxis protein